MGAAQEPGLDQCGRVHRRSRVELAGVDCLLHPPEIDLVQLELERLVEAALGQPPVQRHLPALEPLDAHARARGLAFAAASAGLALAGADAAADTHAILARAGPVGDLIQFHEANPYLPPTTRTRCLTFMIMPRVADVSGSSRVRPILFSPSPINVSRCVCSRRIGLPVCLTLMVLVFAMTTSIRGRFAVDAGTPPPQRRH